jgi:4a-hydroxytetrahydrobiopterin dehydratase
MGRERLDEAAIAAKLAGVPAWTRTSPEWIERSWVFGDFDEAMAFIGQVADVARRLDHHPDLYNVYNRVRLKVSTHDAGGLTSLDFAFAEAVDALPGAGG